MTRWLREFIYTHPIIFIYLAGRDKDVLIGLVKRNIQDSLEYYHYYNFIYVSFVAVYILTRFIYYNLVRRVCKTIGEMAYFTINIK